MEGDIEIGKRCGREKEMWRRRKERSRKNNLYVVSSEISWHCMAKNIC
jgi:hypothetical protein